MSDRTNTTRSEERAIGADSIAELDAGEARRLGLAAQDAGDIDLDRAFEALGDDDWRVRRTAARILGSTYSEDIDRLLVERLRSDDAGERNAAMKSLIKRGDTAVPALVAVLADHDADVRNLASVTLGQIGADTAAEPLLAALANEADPNVVYTIVEALGRIGDPVAVPALLEVLERADVWEAAPAVESLGMIGSGRAVDEIAEYLSHPMAGSVAARALGRVGDPRALPYLVEVITPQMGPGISTDTIAAVSDICATLAEESPALCHLAGATCAAVAEASFLDALRLRLEDLDPVALLVALWLGHEELAEPTLAALRDLGDLDVTGDLVCPRSLAALMTHGVASRDPRIRRASVALFAVAGHATVTGYLPPFLADENPLVRQEAARAAEIAPAEFLAELLGLLSDPVHGVRDAAEDALYDCCANELESALRTLVHSSDTDVAERAGRLLADGPWRTPEAVLSRLLESDDDADVALGVRAALAPESDSALDVLQYAGDPRPRVRIAVASALRPNDDGTRAAFARLLCDDALPVRRVALTRLRDVPREAIGDGVLAEALESPEPLMVITACHAAGSLGGTAHVEQLKELCGDTNPDTRAAALDALRRCDRPTALVVASQWLAQDSVDWQAGVAAIEVLTEEGVPELVLSFLTSALSEADEHIVAAAARALATRQDELYAPIIGQLLDRADAWGPARDAFDTLGHAGVSYLGERARRLGCSGDMRAALILGIVDHPTAEAAVEALCADDERLVRWAGILASGSGGRCGVRALTESWSSECPVSRDGSPSDLGARSA